jgi:hypothetical protein
LDEKLVDKEQSYRWLKFGDIKGETESTIVAAQDQAISTNYFKRKILQEGIESRCRLCKEYEEAIDHLTSGCPILAKNEYVIRHDRVCTHLHYSICKTSATEKTENWYSHIPKPVCQHEDITVLWNQGIQTDREAVANRLDIIIKNMKDNICLLTDVAIPLNRNVIEKESEKKLKYKNLSIEIHRMPPWYVAGQLYLLLRTSHIIRKVLQSET